MKTFVFFVFFSIIGLPFNFSLGDLKEIKLSGIYKIPVNVITTALAEAAEKVVGIPMGYEAFPEFKSNPDNPKRGMIKREDYADLPVGKFNYLGLSNRKAVWVMALLCHHGPGTQHAP